MQAQAEADLVLQGQGRHGHAGLQAGHLDGARVHAFAQHRQPFHHIGGEDPAGVEAARVVDDDGRLADLQAEIEAARQGLGRSFFAHNDFHQRHLVHRREEVQAQEVRRALAGPRQAGDRQGGGVGGKDRRAGQLGLGQRGDFGLDGAVLEHGFDHQVAALQGGVVGGGRDEAEQALTLLRRRAALLHRLVEQVLRILFALVGGGLALVQQDHGNARFGGGIGNARAHHAGAQNAQALDAAGWHIGRARSAFLDGIELIPQRANQIARGGADGAGREVAGFDFQAAVDIGQAALEHAGHDVAQRRVVAKAFGRRH